MRRRLIAVVVLAGASACAAPAAAVARPCVGAEARDPQRTCDAAATRHLVRPTPGGARAAEPAPCAMIRLRSPHVCAFGVRAEAARATVALVGDSHAGHWRAALEVVARRRRWRGLSLTRHGCSLSAATKAVPEPSRSRCLAWKRDLRAWFAERPEVRTVVVSQLIGGSPIPGAADQFRAAVAGFVAAWRALPSTVRRIVVLRDTPNMGAGTAGCVTRAMAAGRPAGEACQRPRREVLPPDPAVAAARRLGRRVQVVDLTPFICGPRFCRPVVGGVLVVKDPTHLTAAFAQTLGPYLDRALGGSSSAQARAKAASSRTASSIAPSSRPSGRSQGLW